MNSSFLFIHGNSALRTILLPSLRTDQLGRGNKGVRTRTRMTRPLMILMLLLVAGCTGGSADPPPKVILLPTKSMVCGGAWAGPGSMNAQSIASVARHGIVIILSVPFAPPFLAKRHTAQGREPDARPLS